MCASVCVWTLTSRPTPHNVCRSIQTKCEEVRSDQERAQVCVCVKVNILAHPIPPNVFRRIKTTYEKVRRDQECA